VILNRKQKSDKIDVTKNKNPKVGYKHTRKIFKSINKILQQNRSVDFYVGRI